MLCDARFFPIEQSKFLNGKMEQRLIFPRKISTSLRYKSMTNKLIAPDRPETSKSAPDRHSLLSAYLGVSLLSALFFQGTVALSQTAGTQLHPGDILRWQYRRHGSTRRGVLDKGRYRLAVIQRKGGDINKSRNLWIVAGFCDHCAAV